jgi:hypothetical protein
MRFQRGNRLADKRKNRRGGRPTKEEAKKKIEAETAHDIIEKNAEKLAHRLINDAMKDKGRRSLHLAINKLVPDAKHTIAIPTYRPLKPTKRFCLRRFIYADTHTAR